VPGKEEYYLKSAHIDLCLSFKQYVSEAKSAGMERRSRIIFGKIPHVVQHLETASITEDAARIAKEFSAVSKAMFSAQSLEDDF
jgi:hypothetical protein